MSYLPRTLLGASVETHKSTRDISRFHSTIPCWRSDTSPLSRSGVFGRDERGEKHGLARLVMPQWPRPNSVDLGGIVRLTDHEAVHFFSLEECELLFVERLSKGKSVFVNKIY